MSVLAIIGAALGVVGGLLTLVNRIFKEKSPEQIAEEAARKQLERDRALDTAMEKATREKDPSDLSRIINSGD